MLKNIFKSLFPRLYLKLYKKFSGNNADEIKLDSFYSHIQYLKAVSTEQFQDSEFLKSDLILRLGLSRFMPSLPLPYYQYRGGLELMQIPEQFAEYVAFLSQLKISSYLEIGVNAGGTFITVCEMLQKVNSEFQLAVGIDIKNVPNIRQYCNQNKKLNFHQVASDSIDFKQLLNQNSWSQFDLIFIDGDHSYKPAKSDYELALTLNPKVIVFHDIVDYLCDDVVRLWSEIKQNLPSGYSFKEFITQTPNTTQSLAGIGILLKEEL